MGALEEEGSISYTDQNTFYSASSISLCASIIGPPDSSMNGAAEGQCPPDYRVLSTSAITALFLRWNLFIIEGREKVGQVQPSHQQNNDLLSCNSSSRGFWWSSEWSQPNHCVKTPFISLRPRSLKPEVGDIERKRLPFGLLYY